ncbi:hypothetical protein [Corallincola holothuriorum]|nr:hypothetical protein [Corallincola holothuriorum]
MKNAKMKWRISFIISVISLIYFCVHMFVYEQSTDNSSQLVQTSLNKETIIIPSYNDGSPPLHHQTFIHSNSKEANSLLSFISDRTISDELQLVEKIEDRLLDMLSLQEVNGVEVSTISCQNTSCYISFYSSLPLSQTQIVEGIVAIFDNDIELTISSPPSSDFFFSEIVVEQI